MTLEEKIKQLEEKVKRAKNLDKVMKVIASDILKEEQLNFKRNSDPDGNLWVKLTIPTINAKLKRGRNGNSILRDKGLLFGSLHTVVEDNSAIVATGPEIKYAKIHNYGGNIKKKERTGKIYFNEEGKMSKINKAAYYKDTNIKGHDITMPKRQFAGINKKNVKKYNKWAVKYIEENILTTSNL